MPRPGIPGHRFGRWNLSRSAPAIQNAIQLFEAGKHDQAKQALRMLLRRSPQDAQANKFLAMFHGALHEDEQAMIFIARAAQAAPDDAEIQFILGNVAMIMRKYKEGVRAYGAAVRLNPDNLQAHDGLGKCLISLGEYAAAMEVYEKGLARKPGDPDLYFRMAVTLALIGRMDEALAIVRRGLARLPGNTGLEEFVAYYQNFADGVDPIAHRRDHERLARAYTDRAAPGPGAFPNDRNPDRPLRVGFLSADFYFHACSFFLEGPLRALDRSGVIPYLYAYPTKRDETTERFRLLGEWRDCDGLRPEEIGAQIVRDRVDVLIDCCAWTERRNMEVCATRWAPVQATWLGYPNTTGLRTIDYRVVDARTDPAGSEDQCTERLLRLPSCFLCYRPSEDSRTAFDPTPACMSGTDAPVTFGSFNRIMKVGDHALRTWARILKAVPGSRLMIKVQIAADEVGPAFAARFRALGVEESRIVTAPWSTKPGDHFPVYRRMDIALDSFPYNGTTTTCEAMWMGVPVIAMAGNTHRSRVGVSLLETVGVPELIARDEDDYVQLAVGLAADHARLAEYHRTLRARMGRSPLTDATAFARDFEAAIRVMWREWCSRNEAGPANL